jgi:diacylglycerol kinase family enzyme
MRIALLINRSAGSFRRLPLASTVTAMAEALRHGGHEVEVDICGRRDLPVALTALAAREDLDAVVVGGGDGTFLTAILAGLGTTCPLGLLPLGTINLFTRDLGLPLDPVKAARRLADAEITDIDLAEVNGMPFAIWASLGMHPWMVRRRDHLQREGVSKWRAMALAALLALRRYPLIKARLTVHGQTITVATPLLVVTNNAWRDGRLPLLRPALDQGLLEVHVARCTNRLQLAWLAVNALLGRWRLSHLLETYRAETVQVMSRNRRSMVSLDGEVTVMRSPLVFKARPKALKVLIPRHREPPR